MFRKLYYALEQYSICPYNFFDHYVMMNEKKSQPLDTLKQYIVKELTHSTTMCK
jgi:hypothetical protein